MCARQDQPDIIFRASNSLWFVCIRLRSFSSNRKPQASSKHPTRGARHRAHGSGKGQSAPDISGVCPVAAPSFMEAFCVFFLLSHLSFRPHLRLPSEAMIRLFCRMLPTRRFSQPTRPGLRSSPARQLCRAPLRWITLRFRRRSSSPSAFSASCPTTAR